MRLKENLLYNYRKWINWFESSYGKIRVSGFIFLLSMILLKVVGYFRIILYKNVVIICSFFMLDIGRFMFLESVWFKELFFMRIVEKNLSIFLGVDLGL